MPEARVIRLHPDGPDDPVEPPPPSPAGTTRSPAGWSSSAAA
ncbi:hypothetical protein ACFQX8_26680 [Klenkia terrae]